MGGVGMVFCFVFLAVRSVVKAVKTYIFCVTLGKFSGSTFYFFFLVLQGQVRLYSFLNRVHALKMLFNGGTQLSNCTFVQHGKE